MIIKAAPGGLCGFGFSHGWNKQFIIRLTRIQINYRCVQDKPDNVGWFLQRLFKGTLYAIT